MLPLLKRRHVRALQIRVRENYFDVAWPDLFSASLPTMAINADTPIFIPHPPGFRARAGLNWAFLGLLYTSFYMCRYNLPIANSAINGTDRRAAGHRRAWRSRPTRD